MNPFDNLSGLHGNELDGLFSSVKKHLKKVTKIVTAPSKLIEKKVVRPIAHEVKRNPVVMAAAVGVATVFAAPLVAAAGASLGFGTGAAAAAGQAITAKTIAVAAAKGAGQALVEKEITKQLSKNLTDKRQTALNSSVALIPLNENAKEILTKEQSDIINNKNVSVVDKNEFIKQLNELASITAPAAAQNIANVMNQVYADKNFEATLKTMLQSGKSINEIVSTWASSKNFNAVATAASSDAVYDYIYKQLIASGETPDNAKILAKSLSLEIGSKAAETTARKNFDWGQALLFAMPVALALIGV